jgi:hypothetical protein
MVKRILLATLFVVALTLSLRADRLCLAPADAEPICAADATLSAVAPAGVPRLFVLVTEDALRLGRLPAGGTVIPDDASSTVSLRVRPEIEAAGEGWLSLQSIEDGATWRVVLGRSELERLRRIELPPGAFQLQVHLAHHLPGWRTLRLAGAGVDLGAVVLPRLPIVSGEVRRRGQGPIANARIGLGEGRSAVTDDAGRFQAEIDTMWPAEIAVSAAGMGTCVVPLPLMQTTTVLRPIELDPGSTLRVAVQRNAEKGPLEVVLARTQDNSTPLPLAKMRIPKGKTDALFRDLASGNYTVTVAGSEPLQRLAVKAVLGAGDRQTIKIPLREAFVHGRLTRGGEPLEGAEVVFDQVETRALATIRSGPDGRFTSAIWEQGDFDVSITGADMAAPHTLRSKVEGFPLIELAYDVPDRRIAGRVVDEHGGAVSGATVWLRSGTLDYAPTVSVKSSADGRFELVGAYAGPQVLSTNVEGRLLPDDLSFAMAEGEHRREVELVAAQGFPRRVTVMQANGAPAVGATLVVATGSHLRSSSNSDLEGRAVLATPPEEESVLYVFPKEGSLFIRRLPRPLDDANATAPLLVELPKGESTVEVATLLDDGGAMPPVKLLMRFNGELVPPEVAQEAERQQGFLLHTDGRGTATLAHVPSGLYELWPYRSEREAEAILASATAMKAPITVNAVTGENKATVTFRRR